MHIRPERRLRGKAQRSGIGVCHTKMDSHAHALWAEVRDADSMTVRLLDDALGADAFGVGVANTRSMEGGMSVRSNPSTLHYAHVHEEFMSSACALICWARLRSLFN